MMLCSRCKKRPAVVFITAMQGEKKKNDGLCLVCAKELHVPQIDEYMKQMGITDEELEQISNQMMDMMDGESFEMGGSGVMPQFLQSFMKDPGKIFGNLKDDGEESNELQTADGDEEIPSADYTEIPSGSRRERRSKRKKELRFLGNYCTNLTRRAAEGKLDAIIGRDKEIARVIQILSRRTKNNPCLIGEPGVGKTAIAEGIALRIHSGNVPMHLKDKQVYLLDLTSLVAGTQFRGQFESRVKGLLAEVKQEGNIILFIDEVHNLVGAGNSEGAMNAANILKPALSRGEVQVIGATTFEEYRKYIEKDSALERRFQPVTVNEPTVDETIEVLNGIAKYYESYHRVHISPEMIRLCAVLSERYITDRFLPDKAIDLMDEACSKKVIAKKADAQAGFCGTVKAEDVAAVLKLYTGVSAGEIEHGESERLLRLEEELKQRVVGQDKAISAVAKPVRRSRAGLRDPKKPVGTFLFTGPSGVGKTELAKALAEALFGDEKALIRFDMSEYNDKSAVNKLIGSPPGYVGYEDGGKLTEAIRRHPYSVVLFDEIEKADAGIYNLFLQLMDDGFITDSEGRKANFQSSVVIMTSNIGAEAAAKAGIGFFTAACSSGKAVICEIKKVFRPEFINRIDDTVVFNRLDFSAAVKIAEKYYRKLAERAAASGIELVFSDEAVVAAAKNGFDPEQGARPLERYISAAAEDPLSEMLLAGKVCSGERICCTVGDDGKMIFEKQAAQLQKA